MEISFICTEHIIFFFHFPSTIILARRERNGVDVDCINTFKDNLFFYFSLLLDKVKKETLNTCEGNKFWVHSDKCVNIKLC